MSDRTTSFKDCPKCLKALGLSCFEQLGALIKRDECDSCGFIQRYTLTDINDVITITKVSAYES